MYDFALDMVILSCAYGDLSVQSDLSYLFLITGEWMVPASNVQPRDSATNQSNAEENKQDEEPKVETEEVVVKGDLEMAPLYATRLLPVFAQTFRSSLVPSIRKATLAIMKKVIHYIPQRMMSEVISSCNVAASVVEVLSSVLNVEVGEQLISYFSRKQYGYFSGLILTPGNNTSAQKQPIRFCRLPEGNLIDDVVTKKL